MNRAIQLGNTYRGLLKSQHVVAALRSNGPLTKKEIWEKVKDVSGIESLKKLKGTLQFLKTQQRLTTYHPNSKMLSLPNSAHAINTTTKPNANTNTTTKTDNSTNTTTATTTATSVVRDSEHYLYSLVEMNKKNYFEIPLELKDTYPNIPEGQVRPEWPERKEKEIPAPSTKPQKVKGPKPQLAAALRNTYITRGEIQLLQRKKREEMAKIRRQQRGKKQITKKVLPRGAVDLPDDGEDLD